MISILIFIAPVILCENKIERSSHFQSPETEVYGWSPGDIAEDIFGNWPFFILKIIGLIVAGTVSGKKIKGCPFLFKKTLLKVRLENNSLTSNIKKFSETF